MASKLSSLSRAALTTFAMILAVEASAHVVFAPPRAYTNPAQRSALDLSPQKATYIALGEVSYREALQRARALRSAISRLLPNPSAAELDAAREAWTYARRAYAETEIFRFNDGPIDAPADRDRAAGPEMRINAWPVDESTIDYIVGDRRAGLINELETPLSLSLILARDQASDESAVTTGWHAIEFLLWGQDRSLGGPGARSFRDFRRGDPARDRRREYLRLVSDQLLTDLDQVASQWQPRAQTNFRSQLLATNALEVVGRTLHGATSYVAIELFGERLSVPLDSGSQEDEHSCFSDTTHLDLQHGVQGVANLLRGEYLGEPLGPGLIEVIAFQDPALAQRLDKALASALTHSLQLRPPFDQMIRRPVQHPDRVQAEATVLALHELALAMKACAEALGLQIVVPGV